MYLVGQQDHGILHVGVGYGQVKIKENQYGGVKGCSSSHLLAGVWQKICEDLEDCWPASLLTSIDYYAKAFNRLSFQHCLSSFADHWALSEVLL